MKIKNPFIKRDIFWISIIAILAFCLYFCINLMQDITKEAIASDIDQGIMLLEFDDINKTRATNFFHASMVQTYVKIVGEQGALRGKVDLSGLCRSYSLTRDKSLVTDKNNTQRIIYLINKYYNYSSDKNLSKKELKKIKNDNINFVKGLEIIKRDCPKESMNLIMKLYWNVYFSYRMKLIAQDIKNEI